MSYDKKEIYEFSEFRLEVFERRLGRKGKAVRLADKAFDTLCVLVRRQGELITKDELMALVWPDAVVEENNLDQKISMLRTALGERSKGKEKIIETVRGHGYRFLPKVVKVDDAIAITKETPAAYISRSGIPPAFNRPDRGNVIAVPEWQRPKTAALANPAELPDPIQIQPVAPRAVDPGTLVQPRFWPKHRRLLAAVTSLTLLSLLGYLAWVSFRSPPVGGVLPIRSIAVLPFENDSNDGDAEYLSDGVTESLINHLSRLSELTVISRSAVFRYKGRTQDTQAIGKELNVGAVLTGSVKHVRDQIVISVRLDNVETKQQIWGNQFLREFDDIISLQSSISREVAENLSSKFSGDELRSLEKPETSNSEAYELYLRGRFFWNKRNKEGAEKAIELFRQATVADPAFALGRVGLADSYIFMWEYADASASEMLPRAEAEVEQALKLDDSLAEAHATSAFLHRLMWQWPQAESEYKRSLALNPNYESARIWYSIYFRDRRIFADALDQMKKANKLDPLSTIVGANTAYMYVLTDDPVSAAKQCETSLEIDPNSPLLRELLGIAYLKQDRIDEAIKQLEGAVETSKRESGRYLSSLGYAYAKAGQRAGAFGIVDELAKIYAEGKADGQNLAAVYAGLGDTENALAWLERDFKAHHPLLPEINWRFAFDGLRHESRFTDLVRRMNLEP